MTYRVVFTPEAEEHLAELYRYIAGAADPEVTARYVDGVLSYCEGLDVLGIFHGGRDYEAILRDPKPSAGSAWLRPLCGVTDAPISSARVAPVWAASMAPL